MHEPLGMPAAQPLAERKTMCQNLLAGLCLQHAHRNRPTTSICPRLPNNQPQIRYGAGGVGEGEFDANRAARGYDWYWEGPSSQAPGYSQWVANQ